MGRNGKKCIFWVTVAHGSAAEFFAGRALFPRKVSRARCIHPTASLRPALTFRMAVALVVLGFSFRPSHRLFSFGVPKEKRIVN